MSPVWREWALIVLEAENGARNTVTGGGQTGNVESLEGLGIPGVD